MLDTPPSRNALDFLDAPGRLTSFLEGRALKTFIRPTGFGMRVLGRGAAPFLAALRRVTGVDLITDLSTFFGLLGDMTDDFSERAAQVEKMLKAPTTAFLLITSAQRARRSTRRSGFAARWPDGRPAVRGRDRQPRPPRRARRAPTHEDLRAALCDELPMPRRSGSPRPSRDYHVLARRDEARLSRLAAELGDQPLLLVPHLDDDVHDVDGLLRVHRFLFASDAERERLIAEVVA